MQICSLEKKTEENPALRPPLDHSTPLSLPYEAEGFQDHRETGGVNSSCGVSRRDDVP